MKSIILVFVLGLTLLVFYPFLNQSEPPKALSGLPWQIEVLPDGTTTVFALHLGSSRLSDAIRIFGSDIDIGVIAARDEVGRLEMYIRSYRVGLLTGKMILKTSASESDITRWKKNAIKSDYVVTGRAKKYILTQQDLALALDEVIVGITFIPSINLDEEIIRERFGEPDKRSQRDGALHFLYLEKGLDIALFENENEVLQYVVPQRVQ